jgi:hypothetical protein
LRIVPRITKKKSRREIENQDLKAAYSFICHYPEIEKHYHHSPNEGKRTPQAGAKLKAMGMKAGFSDIEVSIPKQGYHGLYIEHKAIYEDGTYGRPTKPQRIFIDNKNAMGYKAVFTYGLDDLIITLRKYLEI